MLKNKFFITQETTSENARKWLTIIRYGESGTVIQLQDDCEYRVLEIINDGSLLKRVLGSSFKKYILMYYPVDQNDLMVIIRKALLEVCFKKLKFKKASSLTNSEILHLLEKKGLSLGLFLSHITPVIKNGEYQPLFDLELLIQTHNNLSVIVFSELDITCEKYDVLVDKASFLFDHIIKYPMYGYKDCRQFISNYTSLWDLQVSEQITSRIIQLCGGYLWLIHQALRNLRDNPAFTAHQTVSDELMVRKLMAIWSKFTVEEKDILRKVSQNILDEHETYTHEYEYLKYIGLIKNAKGKNVLGIPVLSQIIEKETKINQFHLKYNRIFKGGKEISDKLSKKEKRLLSFFLSQKNILISRDQIAKVLWGIDNDNEYSDWAIDRLIYRIRRKLSHLGIEKSMIKTVKKKGYIFG